jgi:hypothetical protein
MVKGLKEKTCVHNFDLLPLEYRLYLKRNGQARDDFYLPIALSLLVGILEYSDDAKKTASYSQPKPFNYFFKDANIF